MRTRKSMADSCRKMLAKRWQSGWMTATVDDTKSAVDTPTLTGKEQRSSPVALARRHRPWTTHLPASSASSRVTTVASRHCLHAAGHSATTRRPVMYECHPQQPEDMRSCPSIDLYAGVKFWMFLTSKEGVNLYANQLACEYIRYVNFHVK